MTVDDSLHRPRGDSHGSLGETVMELRLKPHRLRSLRERQFALMVLCMGVSIAVIDGAAVAVALPSIQSSLGFSQLNLAWVLNGYLIPFGGLLLLAGRLGDLIGSKRVFIAGVVLFTAASMVCGLSQNQGLLIGARFAQGAGGALATAVSLSLIVTMFPKPRDQFKALSFYAFVATAAATLGLFSGALLTQELSWHWIFFINVPIGSATVLAAVRLLDETKDDKVRTIDWLGAILLVPALMLAVYTIVQTSDHGWGSARTALLGGGTVLLLIGFAFRQARAAEPLIPISVLRSRNVAWSNIVLVLMVMGPGGMFYLSVLYMRGVLGFSVLQVGMAFLPATVAVGVGSLKGAPRLMRNLDAKLVLLPALALMSIGLLLFARIPEGGHYLTDVLPPLLVMGTSIGLATPPLLRIALAQASDRDSGIRSGLVNMTQQVGSALGLAVLAPIAANVTRHAVRDGHGAAWALTSGYREAFLVGAGVAAVATLLAIFFVKSEVPKSVPTNLEEEGARGSGRIPRDPTGVKDADYLAVGLGGTNMMGMLWSMAMGRRAVAVELRGDPYLNVMHWNVTEELYHHLSIIDDLMLARHGADRLPKLYDGSVFRLGAALFRHDATGAGDARADEVLSGWAEDACAAGLVRNADYVDDRWKDRKPNRTWHSLSPDPVGREHGEEPQHGDIREVLRRPTTFVIGAEELYILIRRYLDEIERMDLQAGVEPRCRILPYHRVAVENRNTFWRRRFKRLADRPDVEDGFVRQPDGRIGIRVEQIRELDEKGRVYRVPVLGTEILDLGVPKLFVVAEGLDGVDAKRLGFRQEPVMVDHGDGRGPVVAQADYIMGLIGVYIENNFRRRIASVFDRQGNEYWVRQVGIGHEGYVESGWILAEVPEFRAFDPIEAGLVAPGTQHKSAEYFGPYQYLIREYFLEQASLLCEIPKEILERTYCLSSPRLVNLVMKIGADAVLAPNGVVAGDSFGNGSFLTTGGATTGMVGHGSRIYTYWKEIDEGVDQPTALRTLADGIKADTQGWLDATRDDFAQPPSSADLPVAARDQALAARGEIVEAARRHRRAIARVDYRDDWSRLHVFPGELHMLGLQPLADEPPDSEERMARMDTRVLVMDSLRPDREEQQIAHRQVRAPAMVGVEESSMANSGGSGMDDGDGMM